MPGLGKENLAGEHALSLCASLKSRGSHALLGGREHPKASLLEPSSGLALRNTIYRPDLCSDILAGEFILKLLPYLRKVISHRFKGVGRLQKDVH